MSSKAGRVRLRDFYNMSLHTHWNFAEKADYLQALGALDTTNASDPFVIVPNYLHSLPNCLDASTLYAVCCRNQCEDFLGELERSIQAPTAAPARIAEVVRSFQASSSS